MYENQKVGSSKPLIPSSGVTASFVCIRIYEVAVVRALLSTGVCFEVCKSDI